MIVFQNPGLVDLDAILTLGVSVKETKSPIGYFGTGFKFAVAKVLAMGGEVTIQRGFDVFEFFTKPTTIRGKDFQTIWMREREHERELNITTELGKNWMPWMAFREFASNCKDEGGEYYPAVAMPAPGPNETSIVVKGLDDILEQQDQIFLPKNLRPILVTDEIEVYDKPSNIVFYRDVQVFKGALSFTAMEMRYTYNFLSSLTLTEDRTVAHLFEIPYRIMQALRKSSNLHLIHEVLNLEDKYLESELNFAGNWQGTVMEDYARKLFLSKADLPNFNKKVRDVLLNDKTCILAPANICTLTEHEQKIYDASVALLASGGINIDKHKVHFCESLSDNVYGMAKDGEIYLSRKTFTRGPREVTLTLLEEYAHLESDAGDCTREFQNWLLAAIVDRLGE